MDAIYKLGKEVYIAPQGRLIQLRARPAILRASETGHIEGVEEGEEHGWGQE